MRCLERERDEEMTRSMQGLQGCYDPWKESKCPRDVVIKITRNLQENIASAKVKGVERANVHL